MVVRRTAREIRSRPAAARLQDLSRGLPGLSWADAGLVPQSRRAGRTGLYARAGSRGRGRVQGDGRPQRSGRDVRTPRTSGRPLSVAVQERERGACAPQCGAARSVGNRQSARLRARLSLVGARPVHPISRARPRLYGRVAQGLREPAARSNGAARHLLQQVFSRSHARHAAAADRWPRGLHRRNAGNARAALPRYRRLPDVGRGAAPRESQAHRTAGDGVPAGLRRPAVSHQEKTLARGRETGGARPWAGSPRHHDLTSKFDCNSLTLPRIRRDSLPPAGEGWGEGVRAYREFVTPQPSALNEEAARRACGTGFLSFTMIGDYS